MGPQHESLEKFWWVIEYLRLPYRKQVNGVWTEGMMRYRGKGWRTIRDGNCIHRSVQQRISQYPVKNINWAAEAAKIQRVD